MGIVISFLVRKNGTSAQIIHYGGESYKIKELESLEDLLKAIRNESWAPIYKEL